MLVFGLSACGTGGANISDSSGEKEGFKIVTTIFPEYDWVENILGDNPGGADVTLLLDNGTDLHSFQPSAEDILKIGSCDLFIYAGGESDEWVDDALKEASNKDMAVINLIDVLGDKAKEEEIVEGMQKEGEEEESEEEAEYDEHVWLSLDNASILVEKIADSIEALDSANADTYKKNAEDYLKRISALDEKYEDAVSNAKEKTLIFGDRFPFRYLVDDYGIDYYAAFAGCSAETEASFETVVFLANKIDELSLNSIMTIDGSDKKIAETVRDNTKTKDQQILTLDSMQSISSDDMENGTTYLSVMEENLNVLEEALK